MDLFIVKERLKVLLWLIGSCVLGGAGIAWNHWREGELVADRLAFLLPALVTGALALVWAGLLISFLISLKMLKREGPPPWRRFENLPLWMLKYLALVILITALAVATSRLVARATNEFTLLEKGKLAQLEEHIAGNPAVLEHVDAKSEKTLLMLALESGNAEAVELLLSNGARLALAGEGSVLVQALNNLPLFETLLRHGANPDTPDAYGLAPIHYAVDTRNTAALLVLLEAKADLGIRNPRCQTPLILATMDANLPMVESLVEAGADPNQWDKRGDTALHKAVRRRNIQSVRFLLENGADPKVFNFKNMAPIHIAALNGQNKLVELFLEDPGQINLRNEADRTPFDYALNGHKSSTVRLLLRNGADIDRVMASGRTVLHLTLMVKDYRAVEFLINEGADVYIADSEGKTAHDLMRGKKLQFLLDLVDARDPSGAATNVVEAAEVP
jgi:ankyrin repeat protein